MTEAAQPDPLPGQGWLGRVLLSLSLGGLPLVLLLLRRLGRRGGLLVACGCSLLFARDLAKVSAGAPARLRPLPRLLLLVEVVASGTATLAGLWAHAKAPAPHPPAGNDGDLPYDIEVGECARGRALATRQAVARLATAATAVTFVLHTAREAIYLSPGHGRR
jgi:hypothetical protein